MGRDDLLHIPVLRFGREYRSMDLKDVSAYRDGEVLAQVSQANAGMVRRDVRKLQRAGSGLDELSSADLIRICAEAAELFLQAELPVNEEGQTQSVDEYVAALSATSGLPHNMCRRNMEKIAVVLRGMRGILSGLMRGLDPALLETGVGLAGGSPISYARTGRNLSVILPSNSPGVNSIWIPALALRTPVVLKPGREEPWTPLRIVRALIAAGCPADAFGFYPTDHEGAGNLLELCDRSLLFGDEGTTARYAADDRIQIHGPGRSKVFMGSDVIDQWPDHLDVLVSSILDNGGRSCINASAIFVPRHAKEIAAAIAERIGAVAPTDADDPDARLSAFANPKYAEFIDQSIDSGLKSGGATDVTAGVRTGPRRQLVDGATYLAPTLVHCESLDHPLANTEYMFPFASVVQVPEEQLPDAAGPSLVVTAITRDASLRERVLASPLIDRLNLGPVPTSHVEWDQPHEGNLFEFLYERRAIQTAEGW